MARIHTHAHILYHLIGATLAQMKNMPGIVYVSAARMTPCHHTLHVCSRLLCMIMTL